MPSTMTAPGAVERAAFAGDAVDGLVVARRIEVPEQLAVRRRERAQMAVDRAREDGVGYCRHGARLRGAAARAAAERTAWLGANQTRLPFATSSAVRPPPWFGSSCAEPIGASPGDVLQAHDVRDGRVDVAAVAGHAPLHAAVRAAFADARLPQQLAAVRRIERVDDAGLLPGDEDVGAARRADQHRRGAEVVVRPASSGQFAPRLPHEEL